MPKEPVPLEDLMRQVLSAEKYNAIDPQLVRDILDKELFKGRSQREAVKATRTKLHQAGGVYQGKPIPYTTLASELQTLPEKINDEFVVAFLQRAMAYHTSTAERAIILPRFFHETLAAIAPVHSIIDLACGLNPLAIPWMPLHPGFCYTACDIYSDMIDFLNGFFSRFKIEGRALLCDVTTSIPPVSADLALVLKTIPCLEQLDKENGRRLLEMLDTPNILVSFPSRSLGGRSKGMARFYEEHFNQLIAGMPWHVTRFEFPGELAFLVQR